MISSPWGASASCASFERPTTRAKFLYVGNEKFYVRGTTYGAFAPNSDGDQFPERPDVVRDFGLMRQAGINAILTYTVPPRWLLDEAQAHGLRAIITVPWMEYECFLESSHVRQRVREEVKKAVASCERHPAVLMFCVAKEIPPAIVRWHGARKVEAFLGDLCHIAKDVDPTALVTYTNFPTTEYLELPFVDVQTFNVYLHERQDFCAYLSRLQHLAGEQPLVLTELGMCSFRHGRQGQADFLGWQFEEAFDHGLAGAVVFGWTDPFYQDHCLVEEWGFGLVDAKRQPKPSYSTVRERFTRGVPFTPERRWPRVSVVVAFHNAARTLDDCLRSLQSLNYPNYEVIMVNDGSTDTSGAIMQTYPFRAVNAPGNKGISAARNLGLAAATGEIVAYIDSDARADPDWLSYLAATYMDSEVAGVGGPNPVPPEDAWIAQCVFRSPGGPTQVMLDDRYAEHIPGCNMSFSKAALDDIGGFDERFTKAADDVDVCWRLLDRGYRIGFSPSAIVWHHRRPSVRAYWRQQVGYGESEALLERKFPNKFNPWGHTFWAGRIYAPYPFFKMFRRPVVYQGLWGSAPFQSMYDPGGGGPLTYLPRAMEWHFGILALGLLGAFSSWALFLAVAGVVYTVFYCLACALSANIDNVVASDGPPTLLRRMKWRAMIAWLNVLEPLARDWGRLKGGLTPWRSAVGRVDFNRLVSRWWQRLQPYKREVAWHHAGGPPIERYSYLERLTKHLTDRSCAVGWNGAAQDWDLQIRRGIFGEAQVRMVVEHHGGAKRLARVSGTLRPSSSVCRLQLVLALAALLLAATHRVEALVFTIAALVVMWVAPIIEANRLESAIRKASDDVVSDLEQPMDGTAV